MSRCVMPGLSSRWMTLSKIGLSYADALEVKLQAQGDDDEGATSTWFDLSLGMEINGVRHNVLPWLPELIASAAASPPNPETGLFELPEFIFLPAPKGGFIRVPAEPLKPWMAALLELVGDHAHDLSGDTLKLSRLDALRTTAALGEGAVWAGSSHLREMVQRLSGRSELPDGGTAKKCQRVLASLPAAGGELAVLARVRSGRYPADDMWSGQTLQTRPTSRSKNLLAGRPCQP